MICLNLPTDVEVEVDTFAHLFMFRGENVSGSKGKEVQTLLLKIHLKLIVHEIQLDNLVFRRFSPVQRKQKCDNEVKLKRSGTL